MRKNTIFCEFDISDGLEAELKLHGKFELTEREATIPSIQIAHTKLHTDLDFKCY